MKITDMIKNQLEQARKNATLLLSKAGVTKEEYDAAYKEIEELEAKLKLAEKEENDTLNQRNLENQSSKLEEGEQKAYKQAFINMLAGRMTAEDSTIIRAALSSTVDADGGLLIPKDQETRVIELARDYSSLRDLVTVEPVTTLTGSRVIEVDGEFEAFAEVTEGSQVGDTTNGQFKNVPYSIKTYGGILPIPNNLLNDSVALLENISKWFAKKKVATENKLIFDAINTLSKTAMTGIDDIKTALNLTLDPAISKSAVIVTNQTGLNELDKLKDTDGKYLLQPNPTKETESMIKGKPVFVFSDKVIKNDTTKAPVIIGNLKAFLTLFDRQALSLASTSIGAGAFETNSTKMRGLLRMDTQKMDEKAVVFLQIDTARE